MQTKVRKLSSEEVLDQAKELAAEFAQTYPVRDKNREFPYEEMTRLKASGLLAAPVPKQYGGLGLSTGEIIETTLIIAGGNPSIAQMYGGHAVMMAETIHAFAADDLKKRLYGEVVEKNAFMANASSERQSKHVLAWETTFTPAPNRDGILIKGKKFFSTGSLASDYLFVPGMLDSEVAVAFVPTKAEGLVIHDDWKAMGQRGTASGTTELNNVYVGMDWVIPKLGSTQEPDPTDLFAPLIQSVFTAIYVGTAQAALDYALNYVKTKTRPFPFSGVEAAIQDPYILQEVGVLSAYLAAAECLLLKAVESVERVVAGRGKITREELAGQRAAAMVEVAKAKVVATEVALRVCEGIFQLCGARSAVAEEDSDRFWRDVRTLTLHDPKDYKARLIGEYLLQDKYPLPGFYS